ncbi:hypothetical protein J6590_090687 [Homalodisca vitripennis]|nr:hypothetical protein J6590_090687 [Homalodisca vitripennis]
MSDFDLEGLVDPLVDSGRSRKRKRNPTKWTKNMRKYARNSSSAHIMSDSEILRVNDGRFNERLLQLLHNVEGDDSDDEPVDDSDEDPNYVVSDNELNQSESDDSFAVDEPQLEDEDDIHYSVENYLVQESEDDFFGGKMVAYGAERSHPSSAEHLNITF